MLKVYKKNEDLPTFYKCEQLLFYKCEQLVLVIENMMLIVSLDENQ